MASRTSPLHRIALVVGLVPFLSVASANAEAPHGGQTHGEAIRWIDEPAEALALAERSGRPVIAYVSSERCGFCRKMERVTWSDPAIADVVAEHFVPLRLDAGRHRAAVSQLGVRVFPTTFVISAEGRGLSGAAGFVTPERMSKLLRAKPAPRSVASRPATTK